MRVSRLGEIEMKSGQVTAGRAHLATIEADAKAKGYLLRRRRQLRCRWNLAIEGWPIPTFVSAHVQE